MRNNLAKIFFLLAVCFCVWTIEQTRESVISRDWQDLELMLWRKSAARLWILRSLCKCKERRLRADQQSWERNMNHGNLKTITLTHPFDYVVSKTLCTSAFCWESLVDTRRCVLPVTRSVVRWRWLWHSWHWHWDSSWSSQIPSKVRWSGIGVG